MEFGLTIREVSPADLPPAELMEEDADRLAENAIKADPQIQRRKQQIRARVLKAARARPRGGM